jgi:hypothetical protein
VIEGQERQDLVVSQPDAVVEPLIERFELERCVVDTFTRHHYLLRV